MRPVLARGPMAPQVDGDDVLIHRTIAGNDLLIRRLLAANGAGDRLRRAAAPERRWQRRGARQPIVGIVITHVTWQPAPSATAPPENGSINASVPVHYRAKVTTRV